MSEQEEGKMSIRALAAKLRAVSNAYGGIPALSIAADWLDTAMIRFMDNPSVDALRDLNSAMAYIHRLRKKHPIKRVK